MSLEFKNKVAEITNNIISADNSLKGLDIEKTLHGYHDVFSALTGYKINPHISDESTEGKFGKANSPDVSANCLFDIIRTIRFIKGLNKAILSYKEKLKSEKVRILYVGSGVYGTLVTPLCCIHDESIFECTALDIHEKSVNGLKKVVSELKIEKYFSDIVKMDAFDYQSPKNKKPHIIISETMGVFLRGEPQVALMHYLYPQLEEGGCFIPEEIKLDLYHSKKIPDNVPQYVKNDAGQIVKVENEKDYLGNILTVNKDSISKTLDSTKHENLGFDPLIVNIPLNRHPHDTLEQHTKIKVYDDVELYPGESALSSVRPFTSFIGFHDYIKFSLQYIISVCPDTIYKVVDTELKNDRPSSSNLLDAFIDKDNVKKASKF